MMCSFRSLTRVLAACVVLISLNGELLAQGNSNSTGTIMWPANPPVGIGTQLSPPYLPQNALHIQHDASHSATLPAILRLSDGGTDTSYVFGALALMPASGVTYSAWSNLATQYDLVLHEHDGDLILANYDQWGGAIRMSTTPDPTTIPAGTPANDLERMTILQNGNVGIDLPPKSNGLDSAADQVHIGGGFVAPFGYAVPIPGLTIYGGNRFEGMLSPGGVRYPVDWRYINFNSQTDHSDSSSNRFSRIAPMSSTSLQFSDIAGGLIQMNAYPYNVSRGMHDFTQGVSFEISGNEGLQMWNYQSAGNPYHHLFDVWKPGHFITGDSIRNDSGLFIHYTPVYIGFGQNWQVPDFTDLAHVHPGIGDGKTWMLAVRGPALFDEAWVNDSDWPDYVFQAGYKLLSIEDFGNFIETNHHLPEIQPVSTMNAGFPLGKTESDLTKQVEELSLYIVQLNKDVEALKAEVRDLKKGEK